MMAVIFFYASFAAIKIAHAQVDPLSLISIRLSLVLMLLWPLLVVRGHFEPSTIRELLCTTILGGHGFHSTDGFKRSRCSQAGLALHRGFQRWIQPS
jgi:drug/metabolite transporter (DMT)-like permease